MEAVVIIPKRWRENVRRILLSGKGVQIPPKVLEVWRSSFPGVPVTVASLRAMVANALENDKIKGVKITTMRVTGGKPDPGEIYEFLFDVEPGRVYSKISLRLANDTVYFYSAHKSERDHL